MRSRPPPPRLPLTAALLLAALATTVFLALALALDLLHGGPVTALSRIHFGVHHPSDVLAAVAEGAAWLALCFALPVLGPAHRHPTGAQDG